MRALLILLLSLGQYVSWSAEISQEDKIVNYLVTSIQLNEQYNNYLIENGQPELVNRTIYFDYNQMLEDEPRVLKAYASEVADLTSEFPKTKKSSDLFNTIQDQIKFYNIIIGAMPDYFRIIKNPSTYRYGQKIDPTGGYHDSQSGYYSIDNYYGQHQDTLYKLMRNTLNRVSQTVNAGENVVFNYFAITKKQTPNKTIFINFVHTDFVGNLFLPHLQDLRTDLTGIMAAANLSVYSSNHYSLDDKLNYHLGASVKVLLDKRNEENSILETAVLNSDPHESFVPWNCPYKDNGAHVHGAHILSEFLEDNGFEDVEMPMTGQSHVAIVTARQEQEGGNYVEYEVELREGMGEDSIWDLLTDWGVNNHYDYCCYRFGDTENRNFSDWALWYDTYALDTPPFLVDLIARIIAAPFISIYGFYSGTDALTGNELSGLDYVFNVLDIIPGVAAFSKTLRLGVKSIKMLDSGKHLIATSHQFISRIPNTLFTFVKTMSTKGLALLPKVGDKLIVAARETSGAVVEIIEFGADQVIKVLREIDPGLAPPQVVYDLGGVSVRQGDEVVQRQLQIVKTGDGQVFVRSTLTAIEFSNQIDNTILRLNTNSTVLLNGTGKYKDVFGHHPLAKKAFEGDDAYNYKEAFCVSTSALDEAAGIANIHPSITGQQNSLYSAWRTNNPGKKLTIDEMADIEIQAMVNVGIPSDIATGWIIKALEDLKIQGVSDVYNIPWNGVN